MARRRQPLPTEVLEVRRRFEAWRGTRDKLGPIPDELWGAAVCVAQEHGVWPVARALRVNYADLKGRAAPRRLDEDGARAAGFVEVQPVRLLGPASEAGAVVELTAEDGAKLRMELAGAATLDVRGLAEAFWRRGT
jgi:hypothetical protein